MTTKTIAQVAEYRPLRLCGIEELAAEQLSKAPSPGVAFARKTERTQKDIARNEVLSLFSPIQFPKGLSILTMPGVDWKFERKLLGWREGNWYRKKGPHRTYLTAIENDRSIYHASIVTMPGLELDNAKPRGVVSVLDAPPFAESCVRNRWVCRHFFGNVDDLMASGYWHGDGAWLDYTGPLSVERMRTIGGFFKENIRHTLVVTALKARWNKATGIAIDAAGGHAQWVSKHMPPSSINVHALEYQDGASPMAQLAFRKTVIEEEISHHERDETQGTPTFADERKTRTNYLRSRVRASY